MVLRRAISQPNDRAFRYRANVDGKRIAEIAQHASRKAQMSLLPKFKTPRSLRSSPVEFGIT